MKPTTVDDYLATVSADRRRVLDEFRKTIRAIVPWAVECISYGTRRRDQGLSSRRLGVVDAVGPQVARLGDLTG